ncbi:alpha/beta hydrolase [Methyloprofundus sp.]|uniref:alpha/beta hydrolase n=1 Tax=Methyloprofundus sp. TaxID=2020875 RepID=UPI003D14A500
MMKTLNLAGLSLLTLLLVGCSSAPTLMPAPNIYTDGGSYPEANVPADLKSNKVDLLYVTDRKPEATDNNTLEYGTGRSASVGFGSAIVEIGNNLSWQELVEMSETSSRSTSPAIKVTSRTELGRFPPTPHPFQMDDGVIKEDPDVIAEYDKMVAQFRQEIDRRMAQSGVNEVHIFVHGFSNTFDWSAASLAELWHFFGRIGVPLLYSWPAAHGGLFGYFADRESGEFTIYHLKNLIRMLASFPEVERINILAHSRGTDVAATALRELIIEARAAGKSPYELYRIENLILAAPDLDFDIVRQRLIAEKVGPAFGQITVYTTDSDKALSISQTLMSGVRLGRIHTTDLGEQEQMIFKAIKNVAFIDVDGVHSFIGHAYYLGNPATSSDIIRIINGGYKPGSQERPLIHRILNFWEMPVGYPGSVD